MFKKLLHGKRKSALLNLTWSGLLCRVVRSVSQLLYLLQRAGHFKFFSPSFFVGLELTICWSMYRRSSVAYIVCVTAPIRQCMLGAAFTPVMEFPTAYVAILPLPLAIPTITAASPYFSLIRDRISSISLLCTWPCARLYV